MLTGEPDEFADVFSANFSRLGVEAGILHDSVDFVQVFFAPFPLMCLRRIAKTNSDRVVPSRRWSIRSRKDCGIESVTGTVRSNFSLIDFTC